MPQKTLNPLPFCRLTTTTLIGLSSALALTLTLPQAHAQTPANIDRDAAEQRRIRERDAQVREQLERAPDVRLPAATAAPLQRLPGNEAPCFTLRQITLRGDEAARFGGLLDAMAGADGDDSPLLKCVGARGIDLVLQRAQNALVAQGYVTSRVLAEPQDLGTGQLALTVIPGRIHTIRLIAPVDWRATVWNALPARPGDILNLRDIEQALENFKRVPTAEADIQITPASGADAGPSQSDLLISYRQGFPLRLSLSADDSGTRSTGKTLGGATLSYDNALTLNDLFYLSLNHDLGGGQAGRRGTRGSTVHYSVPIGYWTLGTTFGQSSYVQTVAGASQNFEFSGTSHNAEVKLSRLVHRDATSKTTTHLKAFARRSRNFIDDTEVRVQRRAVGGWEFGTGHRAFIGTATAEGNVLYRRGTGAFGAIAAPEQGFGEGTSRFVVVQADANLNAPFKLGDQGWRYNGTWRAQLNGTRLTPQERFAIGGRYTVRGFDGETTLSAERGWLLRNDLGAALGRSGQELYLGLDHGQVGGPTSQLLVGRRLTGAVLGLRGGFSHFQYDAFIGTPVQQPRGFRTAGTTGGFNVNLSF